MREFNIDVESVDLASNDREGFFKLQATVTVPTAIPAGPGECVLHLNETSARNLHLAVGRVLANLDNVRKLT